MNLLTKKSPISDVSTLLRVHIAAIGFEVDRIVLPAIRMKADRIWLLVHSRPAEDRGRSFRDEIETAFKEARIEVRVIDADRTDLFDMLRALSTIIMAEKNNAIYVNVSVGSKIQAIASMMVCMMFKEEAVMIKPYYAFPERYTTEAQKQETEGLGKIIELPEYKIETPNDVLIKCMAIIDHHGGKITKRGLKDRALEEGLIHVTKKAGQEEVSDQAPFMALNKNLIDPLIEWNFIRVEKIGSSHVVFLTDEGKNTLRFLQVRTAETTAK